jgi:hypothetical protein
MVEEDLVLVETRSKRVFEILQTEQRTWGSRNIIFEPGNYDGNGNALVRPFVPCNLIGHPGPDSPVVLRNFRIHDALLVNCSLRNNIEEDKLKIGPSLEHHIRLFSILLAENKLSDCSIMDFEDFLSYRTTEQDKAGKVVESSVMSFLKEYLSTMRRFGTLLPDDRKAALPEYIRLSFKIGLIFCNDGIVIWFRRPIGKRRDSLKISSRKFLREVIPHLSEQNNVFPLINGQTGVRFHNLAIVSEGFADSIYKTEGTVFKIPNNLGILEVKSGADVTLENVMIGYVDEHGRPRALVLRGFWILANDRPSAFSTSKGKERAQQDFFHSLIASGPIRGEKFKRYSEADLAQEIDSVKKNYLSLVLRDNAEEPELQQFLEEHPFILSPMYLNISRGSLDVTAQTRLSKGKRIVDFVILFEPDFEVIRRIATLVEIKRPSHMLLEKDGIYSKPLEEGLRQVKQAYRILDKGSLEAGKLGLHCSDIIRGMVLIGRQTSLDRDESLWLQQFNRENKRTKIVTFDSLLENIDRIRDFYGIKGRQPVVVVGQKGTSDEDFTGNTSETIQRALDHLSTRT